ncbi:preprotein translocase subunit YajC [Candidatus Sumerlaeota bacterium]|nr:preprotein translocase subunit YajC [Candidatus Sumerlaeota bacterium]
MTILTAASLIHTLAEGAKGPGLTEFLLPMALIFLAYVFLIQRPQQKKEQTRKAMLEELKKGDEVQTVGGIFGTVEGFDEKKDAVQVKVDRNTTLTINRASIYSAVKKTKKGVQDKSEP